MVVIVKVEMGEYMVKMMGPRVWERFMMVGEMMMRGMMVKKWEIVLVRDYSKVGDMVVFVQMEMGKYMVEMMGPSVWERFMMWQGKVEDMLKEVWDRMGVMMNCGVL